MKGKVMKTDAQVQQARKEYAHLSLETLRGMQVKGDNGLRGIIKTIGLGGFIEQDGTLVSVSSARKESIVQAIYNALEDARLVSTLRTELTEEEVKAIAAVEVTEVARTETDLPRLGQEFFKNFKSHVESLWDNGSWKSDDGELIALANEIVFTLRNFESSRTGERLTPETIKAYKSTLKRIMVEYLDAAIGQSTHRAKYDEEFAKLMGGIKTVSVSNGTETIYQRKYVKGLVDQGLSYETVYKGQKSKENLNARVDNPSQVRVATLYQWATDLLTNLKPSDKAYKNELWAEVAIALMLVTGRRQSEIMSSASFEPTDRPGWVKFYGQLKMKGRLDAPAAYDIPVLASSDVVIAALEWLGASDKRHEDEKVAHNRFSKALSAKAKQLDEYISYDKRRTDSKGKEMSLTCHLCRQMYAQILKDKFESKEHKSISRLLGHGEDDTATAQRYDADIKVLDTELVPVSL